MQVYKIQLNSGTTTVMPLKNNVLEELISEVMVNVLKVLRFGGLSEEIGCTTILMQLNSEVLSGPSILGMVSNSL